MNATEKQIISIERAISDMWMLHREMLRIADMTTGISFRHLMPKDAERFVELFNEYRDRAMIVSLHVAGAVSSRFASNEPQQDRPQSSASDQPLAEASDEKPSKREPEHQSTVSQDQQRNG